LRPPQCKADKRARPCCSRVCKREAARRFVVERFWKYVEKADGCWPWTGGVDSQGYGAFGVEGKQWKAHRFSWELHNGHVPDGLCVCHKCDNPPCRNPAHLFLGTYADNVRDCHKKGRNREQRGRHSHFAKLTEAAVRDIRKRHRRGVHWKALAAKHNISRSAVYEIISGRSWTNVGDGP
jgi:hypothetical protein